MFKVYDLIINNYEYFITFGLLIFALSISGNLTSLLRQAKHGLKEAITPLGFVLLLAVVYFLYQIYQSIMEPF